MNQTNHSNANHRLIGRTVSVGGLNGTVTHVTADGKGCEITLDSGRTAFVLASSVQA